MAWAELRALVSTEVFFSDATPATGGYVHGTFSRELAETLWCHSQFKGRHAPLDWKEEDYKVRGWVDHELPGRAKEALRGVAWTSSGQINFRKIEHVNIQEARPSGVLKTLGSKSTFAEKVVCGIDSTVVLGCWGKGGDSSVRLRVQLAVALGWRL